MRSIALLVVAMTAGCALEENVGDTPDAPRFARARWAIALGGVHSGDNAVAVAIDPSGDVIVGGYFADRADFGSGPITRFPPQPPIDGFYPPNGFVSKRSAVNGSEIWTQIVEGTRAVVAAIAVDPAGNVLATGGVDGDMFIRKYAAADGSLLWEQGLGTASLADGTGIAVGGDATVYVAGAFEGVAFGDGPPPDYSTGQYGTFIAAYSTDGTPAWAHTFIGGGKVSAVSVASDGDLIASGSLAGSISLGADPLVTSLPSAGLLARFSPQGEQRWARVLGPIGQDSFALVSAATSPDGTIVVAGDETQDGNAAYSDYTSLRVLDRDGGLLESNSVEGAFQKAVALAPDSGVVDAGQVTASQADLGTGITLRPSLFIASRRGASAPVAEMSFEERGGFSGQGPQVERISTSSDGLAMAGHFTGSIDFGAGVVTGPGGAADGFVAMFDWVTE